ncbi:MAG TPA: hypothetical protein VFA09_06360 [Ktedonobacteraceae bacterium]|nr:hypothetical protein [Ktedonobacteraceae bacterium]
MADKNRQNDELHQQEKLPRRHLFKIAAEIGAGLFAFIPAAQALAKGSRIKVSQRQATPNYYPCQNVYCVFQSTWCSIDPNLNYWCYDCCGAGFCYCYNFAAKCP